MKNDRNELRKPLLAKKVERSLELETKEPDLKKKLLEIIFIHADKQLSSRSYFTKLADDFYRAVRNRDRKGDKTTENMVLHSSILHASNDQEIYQIASGIVKNDTSPKLQYDVALFIYEKFFPEEAKLVLPPIKEKMQHGNQAEAFKLAKELGVINRVAAELDKRLELKQEGSYTPPSPSI